MSSDKKVENITRLKRSLMKDIKKSIKFKKTLA